MKREKAFELADDTSDYHEEEEDDEDEYEISGRSDEEESTMSDDLDDEETGERRSLAKRTPAINVSRMNRRTIRVKKTEQGENLNIIRIKMEDKKFLSGGAVVRQRYIVNYLTSVMSARHEFYAEMWKNISMAFTDCVDEVPNWTRSARRSPNIERWLGKKSIGFCLSSYAKMPKLPPNPKRESKHKGRPILNDSQLKRPRRYVPKQVTPPITNFPSPNSVERPEEEENGEHVGASAPSLPPVDECAAKLEHVPIFGAKLFPFSVKNAVNFGGMENGVQVRNVAAELSAIYPSIIVNSRMESNVYPLLPVGFFRSLNQRHKMPNVVQALFCGGPLSAMAACPRRAASGEEVVAISTFADEKLLTPLDDTAHVQFWTYPSDLSVSAKLKFILEIPNAAHVLSLSWCPGVTNDYFVSLLRPDKKMAQKKSSERFKKFENILGFLAVGTNVGKIYVYCIPKDLDVLSEEDQHNQQTRNSSRLRPPSRKRAKTTHTSSRRTANQSETERSKSTAEKASPPVLTTMPKFVLQHPTSTMRIDEGNNVIFFKKVPRVSKSATNPPNATFSQYNEMMQSHTPILKDFDDFPIIHLSWSPFENCQRLAAVSAAGRVLVWDLEDSETFNLPTVIHSPSWQSPPVSSAWINAHELCLSFRSKCSRIYDIRSDACLFHENTARTAAQFIYTNPAILPGFFAYDTTAVSVFDIYFSCTNYTFFDADNKQNAIVVPLFNSHQVQVSRLNVCEMSGCVTTSGYDGRLYSTISGRLLPHLNEVCTKFNIGRTVLHILPHSIREPPERVIEKPGEPPSAASVLTPTTTNGRRAKTPPANKTASQKRKKPIADNPTAAVSNGASLVEEDRLNASLDIIQRNIAQIKREVFDPNAATSSQSAESTKVNVSRELCFSHEDCCEKQWLEIRVGDAAMKDQTTLRRVKTKVPDVQLDRRLESLSFIEHSRLTPCLSISGGEAGIVIIMPSVV